MSELSVNLVGIKASDLCSEFWGTLHLMFQDRYSLRIFSVFSSLLEEWRRLLKLIAGRKIQADSRK